MTHNEIHRICKKYNIKNYTINDDGSIDVDGDVYLYNRSLNKLPLRFNKVSGYFNCAFNKLEALDGSPKEVGGEFYCFNNGLKSLEGGPDKVSRDFNCAFNNLTSLKGAPKEVGHNFWCDNNKLETLEGSPLKVGGYFSCGNNLVNLDYNNYLKSVKRMNKLKQL